MTVLARVSSMQVKDEALDELSFRAVEKFNAYMDDIEGDLQTASATALHQPQMLRWQAWLGRPNSGSEGGQN